METMRSLLMRGSLVKQSSELRVESALAGSTRGELSEIIFPQPVDLFIRGHPEHPAHPKHHIFEAAADLAPELSGPFVAAPK